MNPFSFVQKLRGIRVFKYIRIVIFLLLALTPSFYFNQILTIRSLFNFFQRISITQIFSLFSKSILKTNHSQVSNLENTAMIRRFVLACAFWLVLFNFDESEAHATIGFPEPVSTLVRCTLLGTGKACGPCPTYNFQKDQDKDNPKTKVRRNSILNVRIRKNNHSGGFTRWSIVKLVDMHKEYKHKSGTFLYECHDINVRKCTDRRTRRRDCGADVKNEYFMHRIRIPKVFPDGNYVLGWAWYGGLTSAGKSGSFGDFYDCMYLRIQGGPTDYKHAPEFKPGNSITGNRTHCRATVNRLGECPRHPCSRRTMEGVLSIPREFERGNSPEKISRGDYL